MYVTYSNIITCIFERALESWMCDVDAAKKDTYFMLCMSDPLLTDPYRYSIKAKDIPQYHRRRLIADMATSQPNRARASSWLGPFAYVPVEVGDFEPGFSGPNTFAASPFMGPLVFENENSDARDHCANERTFLASLRLSIYMAVVAMAIGLSFNIRSPPSAIERKIAKPLGLIFWLLAVACLIAGLGNYIKTINKFSRKMAIVQSGWRTQFVMTFIACSIFGACVALLVIDVLQSQMSSRHGH
ncbi:hypothetical protein GGS21DRAFT_240473 [Xylaria nigripes]|nr:hypothetical protein GGS21DRAFT_240473 [Xylaria nigripes]